MTGPTGSPAPPGGGGYPPRDPVPQDGGYPPYSPLPPGGGEPAPPGPPSLASGWQRVGAYLIDFVLLLLAAAVVLMALLFTIFREEFDNILKTGDTTYFEDPFNRLGLTMMAVSAALNLVYFGMFEATSGQTPGKRALGIKVVRFDGRDLTAGEALLRNLLRLLWDIPWPVGFAFRIIDAVLVFVGDRRRIGDKIAGTRVVRHRPLPFPGSAYGAQPYRGAAPGPPPPPPPAGSGYYPPPAPGPPSRGPVWRPREAPERGEAPPGAPDGEGSGREPGQPEDEAPDDDPSRSRREWDRWRRGR